MTKIERMAIKASEILDPQMMEFILAKDKCKMEKQMVDFIICSCRLFYD